MANLNTIRFRSYKYLDVVTAFTVAVVLISNVIANKITTIGPFTFSSDTLFFPLTYIFADILTEVYGYSKARRVFWLGLTSSILMVTIFLIVGKLPPAADWHNQDAYDRLLGLTPRIVIAGFIAYFVADFANNFVLAKMKIMTKGKYLWTRTIGSTMVGELCDTLLFTPLAFAGVFPNSMIITMIFSNYLFKTGIEVIFTPVTYMVVNWLKKQERENYFDIETNFSPFYLKD